MSPPKSSQWFPSSLPIGRSSPAPTNQNTPYYIKENDGEKEWLLKRKSFTSCCKLAQTIFFDLILRQFGAPEEKCLEKKKLPLVLGQTNWAESGLTGACRWVMIWLPSSCSWFEHLNHDELCTASPVQVELPREQMFPRRLRAFPSSLQAPPSQRDRDAALIRLASVTTGAQTAGACAGGESTGQIGAFKSQ